MILAFVLIGSGFGLICGVLAYAAFDIGLVAALAIYSGLGVVTLFMAAAAYALRPDPDEVVEDALWAEDREAA